MITCVDVFCGVGGLTNGLSRGGVNVVAGIDIDPRCRFPYERNNRATFLETDVSKLSGRRLDALWADGWYKLLAGCAPCQPFSTYSRKTRRFKDDAKWCLVSDFLRLINEARPDFITMENVPQLADHRVFREFCRSLQEYHLSWSVVECAKIGVPQTRKRLVLLASRHGSISLSQQSFIDEQHPPTVRRAIFHLPALAAGESDPRDRLHSACRLSPLNLRRIRASKPGGTWRDWPIALVSRCHTKKTGDTYPSVYGRMEWDTPSPTITTQSFGYGNGRFGHPEQDRAITLREAAILQTFPDSYQFVRNEEPVRFSVLGRLIGNAVPVRLGEIIAKSFVQHANSL